MKIQKLTKSRIYKQNTKQDAQDFLSKLNVSIDYTTDETFSLIADTDNSDALSLSPNTMDPKKWEGIKNEARSTEKSFPNLDDNFLKMDVTLEQPPKKEIEIDLTEIVTDIIQPRTLNAPTKTFITKKLG